MNTRRRLLPLLAAAGLLLSACAALQGPRSFEISEAKLQEKIAGRFPVDRRLLELVDLQLTVPQVHLLPQSNRIATELAVRAGGRLLRTPLVGTLSMDYGLRYERSDHTLRLADVRVDRMKLDGAPGALQSQLDRLGTLIAEQLLNDQVIHSFRAEDIEAARSRGYEPGEIRVTEHAIRFTLNPVR